MVVVLLYEIVKKGVPFEWGPTQQKAQQDLKILIKDCFHIRMSQTSFSHISINSSTILMVSMAPESP